MLSYKGPTTKELPEDHSDNKKIAIAGQLVGPNLLWTRATFEQKVIQVNKHNKLSIEVHSKLKETFKVQKVQMRFSDPTLD